MSEHFSPADLRGRAKVIRKPPSKAALRCVFGLLLVATDVAAVTLGFFVAGIVRFGTDWPGSINLMVGVFLPVFLVSAGMTRAYSHEVILQHRLAVVRAVNAQAIAVGIVALLLFLLKSGEEISRAHFALSLVMATALIVMFRMACVLQARRYLGESMYSVVELQDGLPVGWQSPEWHRSALSIDVTGFFDPAKPDAASFHELATRVHNVDRIIVRCAVERRAAWAEALKGMNLEVEIVCVEMNEFHPLGVGSYLGEATVIVARGPLSLSNRLIKRLFDIAFSAFALILLAPLLLLTAIAIKLDSPGPVFFVQPRIGRQNRLFRLLKFRSMRVEQCDVGGHASTQKDDSRVTRVGNFIRRTSVDELPQFLNVLLGDMSVVGPRPHAVHSRASNQLFWDVDSRYWIRHACRPGLTGLAQVRGLRGATETHSDLTRRIDADLEYINTWSVWLDVKIMFHTLRVLVHQNAF